MAGSSSCASSTSESRKLDQTPTWAVAVVCAAMVLISIVLEKFLHKAGSWLLSRRKNALYEAVEKVKAELMIMGFISLLLTFFQGYIIKICIAEKVADTMMPCSCSNDDETDSTTSLRRLLWHGHRFLAESTGASCKDGYQPLVSSSGLHQLHILIFFLAVLHVVYSAITMTLGRLQIRGWKVWENEISSHDYEFSNDPTRFRLTHETSFVKAHSSFWTKIPFVFYIGCFLRQFYRSVSKADYLAMRNGFIAVHLSPGTKFNFQKYIKRSLEDDFKVVVGVSPVLWTSFVIFLLLNVNGWHSLFWVSLISLIIILAVGTKLQSILTKMALEITERHAVVQGIPLVQGSDKYFWFGRPKLVLHLIHLTLFQNAFQVTYFLWIWYSFGLNSCFHDDIRLVIVKCTLGVGVVLLCSYITLPLYALITQMGSHMKKSIFDEHTSQALKRWQHMAVKKKKDTKDGVGRNNPETVGSSQSSVVHSSGTRHHRSRTSDNSTLNLNHEDTELTGFEAGPASEQQLVVRVDHDSGGGGAETHPREGAANES